MIFAAAGHGSHQWPLRLRWVVSKVNHIGGVHVGAALAGSAWLVAFTAVAVVARCRQPPAVDFPTVALAVILVTIVIVVVLGALLARPLRGR